MQDHPGDKKSRNAASAAAFFVFRDPVTWMNFALEVDLPDPLTEAP
jgi:hypothetical protein